MAVKNLYGLSGQLAIAINSAALILRVDSTLAGAIVASGFVNATDETYFAITANNVYEVVKVTAVNGQDLTVVRGIDGTAQAFPVGSDLNFVVTAAGILAHIGPITSTVQLTDSGMAVVSNPSGDIWNVHVDAPAFNGIGGISILGTYPNYTFSYTPSDCCGDEAGTGDGSITSMEGSGIASAYLSGGIGYVNVPAPAFTGNNITITGTWPNLVFTGAALGGAGTVTSVTAGGGITVTGSPTVNPTVTITATGVVAGTYGGVTINARGQISAVPVTFDPVSIVVGGTGITANRTADSVTLDADTAAVGVPGVVALVDSSDAYDPLNDSEALTPAGLAVALATLSAGSVTGANSYTGEPDGSYTNVIGGSASAITLASGEKALVHAEVTMLDGTTPEVPVEFGIAIFNTALAKIKSNKICAQSQQSMSFLLEGPVTATVFSIATTAIPGGSSVISYSLYIQKLP